MPITIDTAHGYTVTATRVGLEFNLETTNVKGEVISNVRMGEDKFRSLWLEMQDVAGFDSAAFDAGYEDGRAV
jgi:hypothetical protein